MKPEAEPTISIIIPTLNEEHQLPNCLSSIPDDPDTEIIIADGGSKDLTRKIARQHPTAQWVISPPGRAQQMNHGAHTAQGHILLFLHADSQLPQDALKNIRTSIQNGHSMGCFERKFITNNRVLKLTSRWAGWRARRFFLAYGDQGIFIRKELFNQLGGYREIQPFEDLDLTLRARKHGTWAVIPGPLKTDARRFQTAPIRQILHDAAITILWLLQRKK